MLYSERRKVVEVQTRGLAGGAGDEMVKYSATFNMQVSNDSKPGLPEAVAVKRILCSQTRMVETLLLRCECHAMINAHCFVHTRDLKAELMARCLRSSS